MYWTSYKRPSLFRRLLVAIKGAREEVKFNQPQEQNMREFLKIKICSLAAESRIIRNRERKFKKRRWLDPILKENEQVKVPNPKYRPLPASLEACKGDPREIDRFNTFWGLRNHRMELRTESRHSGLAYGFLRQRPYKLMEHKAHKKPDWGKIEKIATRFGKKDEMKQFAAWKEQAEAK